MSLRKPTPDEIILLKHIEKEIVTGEYYYEVALNALMLAMVRVIAKIPTPGAQLAGMKQVKDGIAHCVHDIDDKIH